MTGFGGSGIRETWRKKAVRPESFDADRGYDRRVEVLKPKVSNRGRAERRAVAML